MRAWQVLVVGAVLVALAGCSSAEDTAPESGLGTDTTVESGIPPVPDDATVDAYVKDLKAIDPAIVEDDDVEKVVDRGRDMCSSIPGNEGDEPKLVDLADLRFIGPDHPDGFGEAKATKILSAVREHVCPTY